MLPNLLQSVKIDSVDVLLSGMLFSKTDWKKLSVSSESSSIAWTHGRIISPTKADHRTITLEWVIDWIGNSNLETAVKHLESMFALQSDLSSLTTKQFRALDAFGDEWILDVTVVDPVEILDYSDDYLEAAYKWRVVLESAKTPIFRSLTETVATWIEWSYGWFTLPSVLPISGVEYNNEVNLSTTGNYAAPLYVKITATVDLLWPVKVVNASNDKYYWINLPMDAGDILIIDARTNTATLNGTNVLANRLAGSEWLTLFGTMQFVVLDWDGIIPNNSLTTEFRFYDQLI